MSFRSAATAAALLAGLAACKPSALGRCSTNTDCRAGAYCASGGICLAVPPSVTVSVPAASDAVNGWVPRTSGNLEVLAQVDDGLGSGPATATLNIDTCPSGGVACSYVGSIVARSGATATFSFQVPRAVQAVGSEAPIPVTVSAKDAAGNEGKGVATLQIDDAPPQIGATVLVTAGTAGEDGNTWFVGGKKAPAVEIAVPVSDLGSGVLSLALMLDSADVIPSTNVNVAGTSQADGWHFQLPASAVRGREGKLHFTLTSTDNLQHVSMLGPDAPGTAIFVDDFPPTVTTPVVDYAHASPAGVCGPADSPTFVCGRQGSTHLLRDDTATVSFDVYDCGVGVPASAQATITSATVAHSASVTQTGAGGTPCASGNGSANPAHHFSFPLNLSSLSALDSPDATGTSVVHLAANASDLLSTPATSAAATAQVSLWRWKEQLAGNITGSPALLAATSGPRAVVVGTDASSGPNLFALASDGSQKWSAMVPGVIGGDVALGSDGATVYVVTPASGTLNIVSSSGTQQVCAGPTGATFGAPPAIANISGRDVAIVVATRTVNLGDNNVFAFQQGTTACTQPISPKTLPAPSGSSAGAGQAFVSHNKGFSSLSQSSFGSENDYNMGTTSLSTSAPPSVAGTSLSNAVAVFGTLASDQTVRRAAANGTALPCSVATPCWQATTTFPAATSSLPTTPVFDANNVFASDDNGTVYGWSSTSGQALPNWPVALTGKASAPVLLGSGGVLVVLSDGSVKIVVIASGAQVLLGNVGAFTSTTPLPPAVDKRDIGSTPGGVAYVPAPSGWIYSWQLPDEPLQANTTVWPRPGHDSCNSRNAILSSVCP